MMEAMITTAMKEFSETANHRPCPNCTTVMAPVDTIHENGFLFVWYECSSANCGGQWLDKKAVPQKGIVRSSAGAQLPQTVRDRI
jgi:hypothetical protein